jgi:hypothetical protein
MCSFTVSPLRNRWYWHHEGVSQFRTGAGSDEGLGYCDATFAITTPIVNRYLFAAGSQTFVDVCSVPGSVRTTSPADDVVFPAVTLGFSFPFYGIGYSTLRPSSNGYMIFGSAAESHDNNYYPGLALPDASRPRPAAFVFNSDLYTRTGHGVCTVLLGSAPARRFAVEWDDEAMCCGDTGAAHYTFESFLNESDGSMDWVYQSVVNQAGETRNFLVGTQNETAIQGSTYEYHATGPLTTIGPGVSLHVTPAP